MNLYALRILNMDNKKDIFVLDKLKNGYKWRNIEYNKYASCTPFKSMKNAIFSLKKYNEYMGIEFEIFKSDEDAKEFWLKDEDKS